MQLAAKGVERIELLFSEVPYGMPNVDLYRFSPTLVSEFKGHLRLQNCHLLPRDWFSGFEELKTLLLEEIVVEEGLLLCLCSKCFRLEELSFIKCQFKDAVNMIEDAYITYKE